MTGTQRKIVQRLLSGDRLVRNPHQNNWYEWTDKNAHRLRGPQVKRDTIIQMFDGGLLRVAFLPGEHQSRYYPTDIAIHEVNNRK